MTTENKCRRFDILGGENKFNLMLGLFDNTRDKPRSVHFAIQGSGLDLQVEIYLSGLSMEDGSGEKWLFKGRQMGGKKVTGCYSTQTRHGWIEFEEWEFRPEFKSGDCQRLR